jgi:hypothetical protein
MAKKQESPQMSLPEIAAEKKRLAEAQAELDAQLAATKEAEFGKLTEAVNAFNSAFGTTLGLLEPKRASAGTGVKRNCGKCHQPGHRAKNCPNVAAPETGSQAAA